MNKEKQTVVKVYVPFIATDFDHLWLYISTYQSTDSLFFELRERMSDMYFYSQTVGYKVIHFIYKTEISNERNLRELLDSLESEANYLVKPLVRKLIDSIYY